MVTDECGRSVQVLPWCDSTIRGRTSNPFRTLHWAGLNIGGGDRRVFTGARANFNICLPILLASLRNDCCVVAKNSLLWPGIGVRRGEPGSGEAGSGLTRVVLNSTVASALKVSVVWEAVVASAIFCWQRGSLFCDYGVRGVG